MPRRNTAKPHESRRSKKLNVRLFYVILPFLAVVVAIVVVIINFDTELVREKDNMAGYLEDRYRTQFDVYNVRREGQGLGVEGSIFADAKPKDGSVEKFLIRKWGDGYLDEYPSAVYNEKEKGALSDVVGGLSVTPPGYRVNVIIDPKIYEKVRDIPGLEETIGGYAKEINYGVEIVVDGEFPTDDNLNDLKILADYVATKNPANNSVRYVIRAKGKYSNVCQYYGGSKSIDKTCFVKYKE